MLIRKTKRIGETRRRAALLRRNVFAGVLAVVLAAAFLIFPRQAAADEKHSDVAGEADMAQSSEVVKYGMLPIYPRDVVEGVYEIEIDSSSNFFRINRCVLTVKEGKMSAKMTMASHSYELLYAGTAKDAAAAPYSDYILPEEDKDGNYVWQLEVEALDKGMYCAAYSKNRHMWYDRQILFNAGSLPKDALLVEVPDYHRIEWALQELDKKQKGNRKDGEADTSSQTGEGETNGASAETAPVSGEDGELLEDPMDRAAFITTEAMEMDMEDGEYSIDVNMTGGSGRATISSPTHFFIKEGRAYARLLWSSTYYDYMIVGGKKYLNETEDGGNSTFTIPVSRMDSVVPVIADTTAMGEPVEIEYNLTFYRDTIGDKGLIPQEAAKKVLMIALCVIVAGGILNHVIKTRRRGGR